MRIACNQCHARYELPCEKLNGGAVRVRCSRCRGLFVVRRRLPEAVGPPPPGRPFLLDVQDDFDPPLLLDTGFGSSDEELDLFSPDALPFDLDLPTRFPRSNTVDSRCQVSQTTTLPPDSAVAAGPLPANDGPVGFAVEVRAQEPASRTDAEQGARGHAQIVSEPVRSGQRVCADGADLVVLGGVSSGAEVVADGDIHVYGVLRGKALAGASGDAGARIFCLALDAELVSVAGTSRMLEQVSDGLRGEPAQIYIVEDELVIETIGPAHFMNARSSGPASEAGRPRPASSGSPVE